MSKSITLKPNKKNEYFLEIEVEGEKKKALLDTGMIGEDGSTGVYIDKKNFDKITPKLKNKGETVLGTDASGTPMVGKYGKGKVKVLGLDVEVEKFISTTPSMDKVIVGTVFLHNLKTVTMTFDLGSRIITFTTKEDEKKEEKKEGKMKKVEFDQAFDENKMFYANSRDWIKKEYSGKYVIIGNGELLDARNTYDDAIALADKYRKDLPALIVFKAEEEPLFKQTRLSSPKLSTDNENKS